MAKAVSEGAQVTVTKPSVDDDDQAVDAAKLAILMSAKEAYDQEPEAQELIMECNYDTLCARVLQKKQDKSTWPSTTHLMLFAPQHPNVELRIKSCQENKGKNRMQIMTRSTRNHDEPPAKVVMYAHWTPGHFNLLGMTEGDRYKIAFDQTEVATAEIAIDAMLTKASQEPALSKMGKEDLREAIKGALEANRRKTPPPCEMANGGGSPVNKSATKGVTWPADRDLRQYQSSTENAIIIDDDPATLTTFAYEETIKRMQLQLDSQSKQAQAQAQLAMQARLQLKTMQDKLEQTPSQKSTPTPTREQKTAETHTPVAQQGADALDMIISGSLESTPPDQPVLLIWSDAGKKKMDQALRKIDAEASKCISKIVRVDAGTAKARHVLHAKANNVITVQSLRVHLIANGLRAELYDPRAATGQSWTLVNRRTKSKKANAAQAGLSDAIAKAGNATSGRKRVNGQCDYYTNNLGKCPRGQTCSFTCYNGPGSR
jgi:hypothetical protein